MFAPKPVRFLVVSAHREAVSTRNEAHHSSEVSLFAQAIPAILLQSVTQKVALHSGLPCQTPFATLWRSSFFFPFPFPFWWHSNRCHLSKIVRHTAGAKQRMCFLTASSTGNLLIEPYASEMSPCINTLFVSFLRSFQSALTLNSTCCSCINAMMWSACWSSATDSISFRGVSRSAISRSFVFFDPSGLSTSLDSGDNVGLRPQLCLSSACLPQRPHLSPVHEGAQALRYVLQCSGGVSRPRPPWFSTFLPFPVSSGPFSWTGAVPSKPVVLAFLELLVHSRPIVLRQVVSRELRLDHHCRFFERVACLLTTMICFATLRHPLFALGYCSVHPSEVSLLLVFELVGVRMCPFLFLLLFLDLSIRPSHSSSSAAASLWFRPAALEWGSL